jgi:hypothetical protein
VTLLTLCVLSSLSRCTDKYLWIVDLREICKSMYVFCSDLPCSKEFCQFGQKFYFINNLIHLFPLPLFNVLKVNDDKLPLPLFAYAVVYGFLLRWKNLNLLIL